MFTALLAMTGCNGCFGLNFCRGNPCVPAGSGTGFLCDTPCCPGLVTTPGLLAYVCVDPSSCAVAPSPVCRACADAPGEPFCDANSFTVPWTCRCGKPYDLSISIPRDLSHPDLVSADGAPDTDGAPPPDSSFPTD